VEASGALEENSRFQLEATYLTLTSNVITAAIQEASLSAQIAAIQDIITAQAQELDLLNQQF
jgi:outer membrane protein TolC